MKKCGNSDIRSDSIETLDHFHTPIRGSHVNGRLKAHQPIFLCDTIKSMSFSFDCNFTTII